MHPFALRSSVSLPDVLRIDQPERRILGEGLGVVDILTARHPAVDGLVQEVCQVLCDEIAGSQTLVQFPHQNEATVRLRIQLRGVSVSEMVEAYLAAVAEPPSPATRDAPILRSLRGSLKNADIDAYRKHLAAKYR